MNERIKILRKELNMTQDAFAAELGIKKSALSMIETGKSKLSDRNRTIILEKFDVCPLWLESGQGEIFTIRPHLMRNSQAAKPFPAQRVPLYGMDGNYSLTVLLGDVKSTIQPIDYIQIPNLPKCDGAVYVVGDSMYPLLKGGDIVMYKRVSDFSNIFWGEMYLLALDYEGEEFITVRYLHKSDAPGYIKLVSQNPHHADKEIDVRTIRAMAFVKASIRMNAAR